MIEYSFPFDTKNHKFEPELKTLPYKPSYVQSLISRNYDKIKSVSLTIIIYGVFSLPDSWKAKIV